MLCSSESSYMIRNDRFLIKRWLNWLKAECRYNPPKFMVDCSLLQCEAIQAVFPRASVYFCHFHVAKLWGSYVRKYCKERDWERMNQLLKELRKAKSPEELERSWEGFKIEFGLSDPKKRFINYMEKHWMAIKERPKWVLYVREDYQHIDTNNLLECWFRTLKRYHLEDRKLRADFVIHKLQGAIDDDFRVQYIKVKHGVQHVKLSKWEKESQARAARLDLEEARSMVNKGKNGNFMVKSFTGSGEEYTVTVDVERYLLRSCSCPDYVKQKMPCKHMYLVQRVYQGLTLEQHNGPTHTKPARAQETTDVDSKIALPPESIISPHLLRQLEAERAKEREQRKRKTEEVTAQAFENCESESQDLWKRLGRVVYGNRKKQCTLKDMQGTVEALKEVVRKAEGLTD
ncbi:MAG: hypothetical protein J3Q66DRAFT_332843 [Benniella sp.]|nr:MAG: hypothetical protein J3Q66DRAFT_332843 [Benniella sp.]